MVGCSKDDVEKEKESIKEETKISLAEATKYANEISETDLKTYLTRIASDEFEGRFTGLEGEKKTIAYLREFYSSRNIAPFPKSKDYLQYVPTDYIYGKSYQFAPYFYPLKASDGANNFLAYIKGSQEPEEFIVITAHMDHMGITTDSVHMFRQGPGLHNGADDNGSGTVAVMAMAAAFQKAVDAGFKPKRSLVFAHFTAEELGLIGAKYLVDESDWIDTAKIVANINLDMVGVNTDDKGYSNNDNYVYVIGSDKSSSELKEIQNQVNESTLKMTLDYSRDDPKHPDNSFERSDQYHFALKNIPVIFYHSGLHNRYHKPEDDADVIAYKALENRTKLAFYTTWELANRKERLKVDKTYKPTRALARENELGPATMFRCLGHRY